MLVHGTIKTEVEVDLKDCVKAVISDLGCLSSDRDSGLTILDANDTRNKTNKRGLFHWRDISHHGSPLIEYEFITNDELAIRRYELGTELKKLYNL